jgi:threonine dehydrogenase-like Zn-dependent dehydrogenase
MDKVTSNGQHPARRRNEFMRGLYFPGDRDVAFIELPDPTPGQGEVIVEMKASGMCGSDLHGYRRAKNSPGSPLHQFHTGPVVCGHEPCGVIAAIGPGVPADAGKLGDRVMVHHYAACGFCNECRAGWPQLCETKPVRVYGMNDHGGHARFIRVAASTLVPLPEELSFVAGAAISCGTGTAYGALRRLELTGRDTLAVFGQGPVGLAATQLATAMGAKVIALDINAARRAFGKTFGADEVIDPSEVDAVQRIKDLTHGRGATHSLDTTGASSARLAAVQCVAPWGKACLVGEGGSLTVDVSPDLLRKQATIIGSWTFSSIWQAECTRFIAERGVDVDAIFTHRWSLDEAQEAYKLFDQQGSGKGVFVF